MRMCNFLTKPRPKHILTRKTASDIGTIPVVRQISKRLVIAVSPTHTHTSEQAVTPKFRRKTPVSHDDDESTTVPTLALSPKMVWDAEALMVSEVPSKPKKLPTPILDSFTNVRTRFHISTSVIGRGYYGAVRACKYRDTKSWYAIKSIHKLKVKDHKILRREVEILRAVQHPHIIQLKEVHEDEKYLHIITEWCTGGDLFDRISAKRNTIELHYSEDHAAAIIYSLLDALNYCHEVEAIVHRDIKPENVVFVTSKIDSPVKLIDFGLSRRYTKDSNFMTTKVGTTTYVAPEVLSGEYTQSCDVWSIGVIAYILLCGYPPFDGVTERITYQNIFTGHFTFPLPGWGKISCSAKEFICFLLTVDQFERPTASEAMEHRWVKKTSEAPVKPFALPNRKNRFNIIQSLDALAGAG